MINQKQASGYAVRLTETLHDRIIFVFTVIMGSALVIAARQLTLPVQCAMIDVPIDGLQDAVPFVFGRQVQCEGVAPLLTTLMTFLSFILVFARFFIGDLRLLDEKYVEYPQLLEPTDEDGTDKLFIQSLRKSSNRGQIGDIFNLTLHASLFVILASSVSSIFLFSGVYAILMVVNVVTLLLVIFGPSGPPLTWRQVLGQEAVEDKRIKLFSSSLSSLIWVLNNTLFVVAAWFVAVVGWTPSFLPLGPSAMLLLLINLNSVIDLALARHLYFPPIARRYEALKAVGSS